MILTPEQLHILQHSLGLDKYGQGSRYRNRYVVGPDCDGFTECQALVKVGYMFDHGAQSMCGGMHCFEVTAAGMDEVSIQSPKPPKVSKSKQRYQDFLKSDCGEGFGEWLRRRTARERRVA